MGGRGREGGKEIFYRVLGMGNCLEIVNWRMGIKRDASVCFREEEERGC